MTNPIPVTVIVSGGEPAGAVPILIVDNTGTGFVTWNCKAADAPPPGDGFVTTTGKSPAIASCDALTLTTIEVGVCETTVSGVPPILAVDEASNPLPTIDIWSVPVPAGTWDGDRPVVNGAGLITWKRTEPNDALELGFETVIVLNSGALFTIADGNTAVITVELINVLANGVALNSTAAPGRKPDPMTVSVMFGPPINPDVGVIADTMAPIFRTVKVNGGENVPPPGWGFRTVMESVPMTWRYCDGMTACNCDDDWNLVTTGWPLMSMDEVDTNEEPDIVSVVGV